MYGEEHSVCKLKKNLYGLKQATREWYLKFDRFKASSGYSRLQADHCWFRYFEKSYIILLLYVDDMLAAGASMKEIVNLKAQWAREFSMKNLDPAKKILGMRTSKDRKKTIETVTSRVHWGGAEKV